MRCENCVKQKQDALIVSNTGTKVNTETNISRSESKKPVIFNGGYLTRDKNSCITPTEDKNETK